VTRRNQQALKKAIWATDGHGWTRISLASGGAGLNSL
jgi:hypothetical protein